ncbi:major capsid protein [Paracoccus litorisediminis]|uniref:Uncharacterized protein n=1 Tax=Paracoccus litorisediminis TaxID=2006130 RepID=A0A844HRZ8_9RHOB|nr:hypothetical protein [Paracoccus litorisediminis]MTH60975.1 hypothetical protein [Paracoccus litorisediminis]
MNHGRVELKNPDLVDILSRTDPDGKISDIIELAEKSNLILKDAVFTECNDGAKHQHVIRTGIPEPAFRRYNAGVKQGKSTTAKVVDTTGMVNRRCGTTDLSGHKPRYCDGGSYSGHNRMSDHQKVVSPSNGEQCRCGPRDREPRDNNRWRGWLKNERTDATTRPPEPTQIMT